MFAAPFLKVHPLGLIEDYLLFLRCFSPKIYAPLPHTIDADDVKIEVPLEPSNLETMIISNNEEEDESIVMNDEGLFLSNYCNLTLMMFESILRDHL